MQATDPHGLAPAGEIARGRLRARIDELAPELGSEEVQRCAQILADAAREGESVRDALSTRLMASFREKSGRGTFGLLYELNSQQLLIQVASRLRRFSCRSDPRDVLQEVFFNVYRYPHRFNPEREDAFRVWSAMIVRNTVLKHLRSSGRGARVDLAVEEMSGQPSAPAPSPLSGAIEEESRGECARVYLTYLHLYLHFYGMLSERERAALHMVEVEETSYRHAAEELGIKLENLKMVIFRARRKIHRAMRRVFDGLPSECRPARAGQPAQRSRVRDAGWLDEEGTAVAADGTAEAADGTAEAADGTPEADASEVE